MLEKYLQMFAKLRTDRGRDRYPEITHELGSEQDKWENGAIRKSSGSQQSEINREMIGRERNSRVQLFS